MKKKSLYFLASIIILSFGCDRSKVKDSGKKVRQAGGDAKKDSLCFSDTRIPPKAYYEAVTRQLRNSPVGLAGTSQVLYINFDGATVRKGHNRGESFIPCANSITVPAAQFSSNQKNQILEKVQKYYDEANVEIKLATEKPSGNFTIAQVGGSNAILGCGNMGGVLGVAPLDKGNVNPNDVVFVFPGNGQSSVELMATTIAHEAAHSFGIEHIQNQRAVMNPSAGRSSVTFSQGPIAGGWQAGKTVDNVQLLQSTLGIKKEDPKESEKKPPVSTLPERPDSDDDKASDEISDEDEDDEDDKNQNDVESGSICNG